MGGTHGSLGIQRDVNGKIGRCKLLNMHGLQLQSPTTIIMKCTISLMVEKNRFLNTEFYGIWQPLHVHHASRRCGNSLVSLLSDSGKIDVRSVVQRGVKSRSQQARLP